MSFGYTGKEKKKEKVENNLENIFKYRKSKAKEVVLLQSKKCQDLDFLPH